MSKEKGHKRLLNVIAKLNIPYHYTIIGNGNEKESILELAKTLNIFHKITHIPQTDNIAKYLSQSDLFLQGSYVEGFPNALLESCAVGIPVIAFKAPGGTKEIVNENNGSIVNNEDEYLLSIENALAKDWNPKLISESVNVKFNKKVILNKYEKLFQDIACEKIN